MDIDNIGGGGLKWQSVL